MACIGMYFNTTPLAENTYQNTCQYMPKYDPACCTGFQPATVRIGMYMVCIWYIFARIGLQYVQIHANMATLFWHVFWSVFWHVVVRIRYVFARIGIQYVPIHANMATSFWHVFWSGLYILVCIGMYRYVVACTDT